MQSLFKKASNIIEDEGPVPLIKRTARYITMQYWATEDHLQQLRTRRNLSVAEIGVWKGHNAARLIRELDIDDIYLIDPYEAYQEFTVHRSDTEKLRSARKEAHERLADYSNVHWIQKFSNEAIDDIDTELDYVYIDGNHNYEYVKQDMETYFPIIKDGGIMAGDDIHLDGVARAFVEFSSENGLQPHLEPYHPDWYFIKRQESDSGNQSEKHDVL